MDVCALPPGTLVPADALRSGRDSSVVVTELSLESVPVLAVVAISPALIPAPSDLVSASFFPRPICCSTMVIEGACSACGKPGMEVPTGSFIVPASAPEGSLPTTAQWLIHFFTALTPMRAAAIERAAAQHAAGLLRALAYAQAWPALWASGPPSPEAEASFWAMFYREWHEAL